MTTSAELREQAAQNDRDAIASFDRCDTDGFLSQWASGVMAQRRRLEADIMDNGGRWEFTGLYAGDVRVAAKLVSGKFGLVWLLREDAAEAYGRKFIGFESRKQLQAAGLTERAELDTAAATNNGDGTCWARRTGDQWGADAELVK